MFDSLLLYGLLCLSAFAAGVVNAIAGGGTLLTFPSLLAVPLQAVVANTTSTVALVPGSVAGAWGYRRELQGTGPWMRLLIGPSLLGGLAGSLLLTRLDPHYFQVLVPWLLLTASLLFLAQPRLARWLPSGKGLALPSAGVCAAVVVFQFFVGVYGGYFGAGIGILMLTSLSLMGLGDVHRMNAVKSFLAFCINGVSVLVFLVGNQVAWEFGPLMAVGAILGGYCGARVGRRLPTGLVRWFVVLVGLGLAVYYFVRQTWE
jgi:uncharacterized membrane protein YfcA